MELKEIANEIWKFMVTFVTNYVTPLCVCALLGIVTFLAQKWFQKRFKIHNLVKKHTSHDICTTQTKLYERIDAAAKYSTVETVHDASKLVDDNFSGYFEETPIYNRQTVEEMTEIALNEKQQYNSTKTKRSCISSEIKSSGTRPVALNEKSVIDIRRKPDDIDMKIKDNQKYCYSVSETNKRTTDLSALIEKSEIDFGRKLENTEITIKESHQDCANEIVFNVKKGTSNIAERIDKSIENQQHCASEIISKIDDLKISMTKDKDGENNMQVEYETNCRELIERMKILYSDKLNHVTIFPLNDSEDEQLRVVFMPPKIVQMYEEKGEFKKSDIHVTQYKALFFTANKVNPRIFLQGESGSGKTTFLAKLALDWCGESHTSCSSDNNSMIFADVDFLQDYMFVFHIALRKSVKQSDVYTLIKQQIIDSIYSQGDRKKAYTLLNKIMKRERCLVLLDGLDEWIGHEHNYNRPTLVTDHRNCAMLITSRPWKLAEGKCRHSDIDALLHLDGINKPLELSRIILSRLVDKKDLEIKFSTFTQYIAKQKLEELLSSPMMLSTIVCSYAEGRELKGSKCEIYILLVESLFKKANIEKRTFALPPFPCFTKTEYIQPNMEHLNRLAEMAFHVMFVNAREYSLEFSITELQKFKIKEHKALKSGILSASRNASTLRPTTSFRFIHLSIQEYLAAYHIALNTNLIDGVISVYLDRHEDAYRDISQVFIFLCGLDISAAKRLSSMMDERVALNQPDEYGYRSQRMFQEIILAGHKEAVANGHTAISLKLSHFEISRDNIIDIHSIWINNTANAISLHVYRNGIINFLNRRTRPANDASASDFKLDLNSCCKLKRLHLRGPSVLLTDSVSSASSDPPVWIVLNSADPNKCINSPPLLSYIEHIELDWVTCSSTWIRSLLSTLLTLDHKVECKLSGCHITSIEHSAVNTPYEELCITTNDNKRVTMSLQTGDIPDGLLEAIRGLDIKSLSLLGLEEVNYAESLSRSLSSLTQLETLILYLHTYITLQLPQSLKYLHMYCVALLPSKLSDLVDTMSTCTHMIEIKLEFGCASSDYHIQRIPLQEYIPIKQKLDAGKNFEVKRFRKYEWTRESNSYDCIDSDSNSDSDSYSDSDDDNDVFGMTVRDMGCFDDAAHDDFIDKDDVYERFAKRMKKGKLNQISIRLKIKPTHFQSS